MMNHRRSIRRQNFIKQFLIGVGSLLISATVLSLSFNHPGALHSQSDLEFMKSKVQSNSQPWKSAYEALKSSKYANSNYDYNAYKTVKCGSYNNPNVGCNPMVEDAMAAYTLALRWYISGESKYADQSIEIINAWSDKYRENTESNARLVVSWTAPWYVNAAEILRYNSGSGWTSSETNNLNSMLNRFKNYISWEDKPANNWMMSALEARLAIAIFQNDSTAFNNAVERWKFRVKTYIYQTSDGSRPVTPPSFTSAQNHSRWKSGSNTITYIDGLSMETCRDWNHTRLGVDSIIYGAQMAWNQGEDLFSAHKNRLVDFFELHSSWLNGDNVPNNICDGDIDWKGDRSNQRTAFEIAYNHLHERLDKNMPETNAMINADRPRGAARWVTKWETLGFANQTFSSGTAFPPTVWFNNPNYNPTVSEDYQLYVNADADDADGSIANIKLFINNELVRQETNPPYEWGHDGSPDPQEVNNLTPGTYTIKAVATDNSGLTGEDSFTLTVTGSSDGSSAPTVSFNNPAGDQTVSEGYQLYVNVKAEDDGAIDNVKLYVNNELIRRESAAPYEWGHDSSPNSQEVNNLAPGTYTIKAVATDDDGLTGQNSFTLTVTTGGSSGDGTCHSYSGSDKKELNLSSMNCVTFAGGLSGKTLQFWDSDSHSACDFRGTVSSTNGAGSTTITGNYQSVSGFSGSILKFAANNGCDYIKIRAY